VGIRRTRTDRSRRARPLLAIPVAVALVLGACSSDHGGMGMDPDAMNPGGMDPGSGSMMTGPGGMGAMGDAPGAGTLPDIPGEAGFNAADVVFAQQMIVHHGQAVAMADQVIATSDDPEVVALAEQIKAAQAPEIATMTGWLQSWGYEAPDPASGSAHGGGMGSMGTLPGVEMPMSGMMTDAEMDELAGMRGVAFDRMFLTMMIRHHEGAIEMAEALRSEGEHPPGQELAASIIAAQQTEIDSMRAMLAARPG
jgi:uncharacterized protein (DUF305 family)